MTYVQLDAALGDVAAARACLWMRYMVLGPTPEFCLHSGEEVRLPRPLEGIGLSLRTVWPNGRL
jgi:hypothetical protein